MGREIPYNKRCYGATRRKQGATRVEAIKAKIIKMIDECNDLQKLNDFNIILEYIFKSSDEEKAWFKKISKSKGFNVKLFAQRLRESAEVTA